MKLSASQIEASYMTVNEDDWAALEGFEDFDELPSMDEDLDETVYRTSMQRKEIRTKALRDRGEVVGGVNSRKHRKY